MALKHPSLLYAKPTTLKSNMLGLAGVLDIPVRVARLIITKKPQLLTQRAETIARKIPFLDRITKTDAAAGLTVVDIICAMPAALTYSDEHLADRCEIAERRLSIATYQTILTMPRVRAKSLLSNGISK
jgi:hypothetical protein